ncbi:MAG: hypothetical protein J6X83_04760 [Methanomicrobium sp.]|nr:hypothetical protein [Methanomicrobium sp.]
METGKILTVLIAIALVACMGYIIWDNYLMKTGGGNVQYIPQQTTVIQQQAPAAETPAGNGGETVPATYIHSGEVYATPSEIKSMDLNVEAVDWDGVVGNDGITIHFNFYDAYGRKVIFSGYTISLNVDIYSPEYDTLNRKLSVRNVLYKGYATVTSSDQGDGSTLAGIRVPFSDMKFGQYDKGIGLVKITASMPSGGTVIGEEIMQFARNTIS